MSNSTQISEIIGSIRNATDIAKAIKISDSSLEKAELKLRLADLIGALVDAKLQVSEIQDLFREKDEEILRLEKMLELKAEMVRENGLYYDKNLWNTVKKEPFCSHCWEAQHLAIHTVYQFIDSNGAAHHICPSCKTRYEIGGDSDIY